MPVKPGRQSLMTTIFTIGHSTHPIAEFTAILRDAGVDLLADIRTVPKSRHNPQFHIDQLPGPLGAAGIGYRHLPGLGGLRKPAKDSANAGWRNESFRGYADYMQTPAFEDALDELIGLAEDHTVAIMCSEAVFWRCHRAMVADALLVRGFDVQHIMGPGKLTPAKLTSFAKRDGAQLIYPPE
jgi:uncharacterized protein (DUF488 family)